MRLKMRETNSNGINMEAQEITIHSDNDLWVLAAFFFLSWSFLKFEDLRYAIQCNDVVVSAIANFLLV